ncbi:hypothetical protein M9978_08490 [Sphingomonas sp. MG17]|uniref:Glycosyltransferase RgtA/B/C/D-like domain-containing protein n=1 Tax=Sphingomonas tagetis TaxID=2949092 RepID=A0A9X2KLJ5_9SPHN|nr:hypothetical protein [Sphingomonas tagetis]MCP3730466.1 hypothetical protein [Sphingomonas tagetis]
MGGARARWRVPVLLFALVWLSCAWFGSWAFNPNNATRLFAAIAIAETGDAKIDGFADMTIDKARFDGHFYSDKAPGVTLMAVPWVAAVNAVTGTDSSQVQRAFMGAGMDRFLTLRQRVVTAMVIAVLTALAAVALFDLAGGVTGSRGAGLFAALCYGLGTPVWGWSTTLFGHAPVAALLVIGAWAVWRGTQPDTPQRGRFALLAGFALGWVLVVEHSALLMATPIGLWALWRTWRWTTPDKLRLYGLATAAGIAALLPLIGYNLLAFGTPFRLGYSGVVGFEGMRQGLFGLTYPKLDILYEITFGSRRGMLWVAPVMLLAPFGFFTLIRKPATRDVAVMALAVAATAFLYNAAYIYWDGGNSTGPRHAVPALGFLALGAGALWASADRWERVLAALLLAASIAINLVIAAAEIMAPADIRDPLRDHLWSRLFVNGQLRTIPSEFWGWTPWPGLWLYLALASLLTIALALSLRREKLSL